MKKILLIATGGTIASVLTPDGLHPSVTPSELLNIIPELKELCEIHSTQLFNVDSTNICPEHWLKITEVIENAYQEYDGFVITHGTDTMAYTASALSYLMQNLEKPVILTGSQKPILEAGSDGRKNLKDSFRFACEEQVKGVYVVFSGQAILGTRAKKLRSKSYEAFSSINYPIAAFIDDRRIIKYSQDVQPDKHPVFYHRLSKDIFLLKLFPGIQPEILDMVGDRYRAIVIESYGVGGLPFDENANFLEKLAQLSKRGIIIIVTTQVMLEGSDMEIYEVGVRALKQAHVLQAYDMTMESIITKMMWILGETSDPADVRRLFYTTVNQDILVDDENISEL